MAERCERLAGECDLTRLNLFKALDQLNHAVAALQAIKCPECNGDGSWVVQYRGEAPYDLHGKPLENCNETEICDHCKGSGKHPVAEKALKEMGL